MCVERAKHKMRFSCVAYQHSGKTEICGKTSFKIKMSSKLKWFKIGNLQIKYLKNIVEDIGEGFESDKSGNSANVATSALPSDLLFN